MSNIVYLETCTNQEEHKNTSTIIVPIESFITYCVYKYCVPSGLSLKFVHTRIEKDNSSLCVNINDIKMLDDNDISWQVSSCLYPIALFGDTIITGLCAVARHICKHRSSPLSPQEHEEGLLGFRKSCLQAPNEVSIWTKFCEVDIIKTVKQLLNSENLSEIPKNLLRFENHLRKPCRIHNVYKIARDIKKANIHLNSEHESQQVSTELKEKTRVAKPRKWKSNVKKDLEIDCSIKMEDLKISHQFAEGPFLTLPDLILMPSYHIIIKSLGHIVESLLPLTFEWFNCILNIPELSVVKHIVSPLAIKSLTFYNTVVPPTEDVSLYKSDPKRHNPTKRLFTKMDDVKDALSILEEGMELNISSNLFKTSINWNNIPDGANPAAGHLPDQRIIRKSQQLENLAAAVLEIANDGDLIVDFCSGSGHLGILIAHLLPKCTVILMENKEQSLLRAKQRVNNMGLKNVYFFQCNLDFFIGNFDIGIALHACGIASDLVLDKCLKAKAKFVLCPCCYGSLHATDRLVYPRSSKFSGVPIDQYLCIGHAADQTHKEHPLTVRGARCMVVIDSDRARLAEEFDYKVTLSKLQPLSCTPKNNLLVGVPT